MKLNTFILVSLFFHLVGPYAFSGDREIFLKESQKIVKFYEAANYANMVAFQGCACLELQKRGQTHPSCQVQNKDSEQYRFISYTTGKEAARNYSCADLLDARLLSLVKEKFRPMRIYAALAQAEGYVSLNEEARNIETETINPQKRFQYKEDPVHKFTLELGSGVSIVQMQPLDYSEVRDVQTIYNQDLKTKCQDYTDNYEKDFKGLENQLGRPIVTNICDYLLDRNLGFSNSLSGERKNILLNLQKNYVRWSAEQRPVFKSRMQMEYRSILQNNPIVALVKSPQPTLIELVPILDVLVKNALSRLEAQYNPAADINQYVYYPYAMDYAKIRLFSNGWPKTRVEAVVNGIEQQLNQEAIREGAVQLAGYTALFLMCYAPLPTRAISLGAALIARNFCFVGLTALDTGRFMYMNMKDFHSDLQNFFSTTDGNAFIAKFSSLESYKARQFVAAALLPFASGLNKSQISRFLSRFK